MAFRKQKQSFFITILLKTALMVVPVIATTNIDCKGKAFHCVNSTHFKICVDFGGVSKTVDDFLIPCPPSTACTNNNYYECEYQMPTTPAALDVQSDVTNELSESPISSPWELFDVSTLFPLNNNERSIELSENSNITPPDTVFEIAGTETADTHHYSLVNEVKNEVITENILYKTTVSDLSESDINNPPAGDVVSSTTVMVAINGMPDYLNTTIPYAAVNVNNYSTTESAISDDLFNTLKTTALNNVEDAGFIATTLFAPVMTYNLSTDRTSEKTTENYISTKSEMAIDLYDPPVTTFTNNIENEDFPSTITDNLSKSDTAEKATTEKYPSTKSEMAVDLNELAITTLTNNIRNENFPSTITETLSTSATTEKYTSTAREITIDFYEPVITTLKNYIENENLSSTITDNLSTSDTAEKATTEKYPNTKSQIVVDLNDHALTTLTNNTENENLPSTITETLSTSDTVEKEAATEKYTSTKREIAIDLYEPHVTTLTNKIENEGLSPTITDNLIINRTAEKATTEKYPSTKSEMAVDLNDLAITTLTNNTKNENLPSTVTETLSTSDTVEKEAITEKYTSTTRDTTIDFYEPVITTLKNIIENENMSSTITDNLRTSDTAEKATTEKYPSTKSEMAVDLNELAITTLTNNIRNENFPSTITETLSTSATTEKYTSTTREITIDFYEPVITTLKNYIENENMSSTITDNLRTSDTAEKATTEKYPSTKSEMAVDLNELAITTLTNNTENENFSSTTLKNIIENENMSSTITDNLSTSDTAEKATTEKYPSTKSEIAVDLNEFAVTTLTNNTENENLLSTITETLSTSDTVEKEATTEKYTSTTREITIDFYEPVIITLKNNIENENMSSTITDNLSTSDTAEKATTEKYPSTKSEMAVDLNELAITTLTNNTENENLSSTITETLSTSDTVEKEATTEKYTSTAREIAIDLYEPPITTLTNKIENEDFSSTITDNLIINRTAEKATTEKYTSTKSEIAIDLYEAVITLTNNIENLPKTITNNFSTSETAFSEIKKNITNNEASEIDLTGTSDSYLVSTQDTTVRDVNIPTETATHATISFTNTVKKSSIERADDNFKHANSTYMNKNDEISSYSKTVDSIQMESPSTITENAALEGYSTKEQKDFLSRPDSLKIENIFTSTTDSTKSTGENISTVKDFNHLITQAIIYQKKDSNDKDIQSNIDYTTVYSPVITESNSNTENIINSSSDAIIFSTISDSYLVNVQEDRVKKDVNSSTTVNDGYKNAGMNSSQVDDSSMHETLISNADLPFTPGYDKELQLTTNVNLILKDTTEEISATQRNDIYLQIRESGIKNEILATKSTITVIDSTISYEANHSITYTVNEIEGQTNLVKKISNDTAEEILTHKKDIFKKEIDHITSPLPPNADSVTASFFKNNSDEISLTTVNVGLNDQVEELLNEENNHFLSSVINKSSLVTNLKNITKNLSLLPDLIVSTESYRANSQQNTTETNLQFSTSSLTDETKEYQLNNQNSKVTETLTHESFAKTDEYGSKHYDNDGNTGNISKPVYTESLYRNVNSTQSDPGILKRLELEHLVNNKDTNNTIRDGRRADIGLTISKNSLKVASNIEYLDNAAVSNNVSTPLNLSANIYKKINKTNDDSTWNSVKSGGLNIHDNSDNLVPLSNQNLQYTLNSTLEDSSKNPVSNTYSTYMLKNKTSLSNISENPENVLRNYQNNSNIKMISNKTRKDVIDINARFINKNEQINFSANQDKRKGQNNRTTKITANVQLNNCNSSTDYERTIINNNCKNRQRGKYADKKDCQKFYICIGRSEPIFGKCPNNTVFSEISKQCTKNLSHCIRNNQFQCTSEGRYIDIFSDQFYFICAKNVERYIRFKLKCQKGYHLDKSKVHCILDSLNESMSHEDISETDREKSTIESKSKEETDSKNQKNDFELKCQKGYHLDKSKLHCILDSLNESTSKEDISKTDREKSTTENKSKEDRDSKYQKSNFECKKEGKFVYPNDCKKYYKCTKVGKSEFRRRIKKCGHDEIFHTEKRKCVDDDSYECNE